LHTTRDVITTVSFEHAPVQPWYKGRLACFLGGCLFAACAISLQGAYHEVGGAQAFSPTALKPVLSSVPFLTQPVQKTSNALQQHGAVRPAEKRSLSLRMAPDAWWPTAQMPRKFIVGGNWKCNGDRASIRALVDALNSGPSPGAGVEVIVAPPMLYGDYTRGLLRPDYQVAFQNCWVGGGGAFTGEVSADMIHDAGFDWVILGHSERRSLPEIRESDEMVAAKTAYALEAGLSVILCIGEKLDERQSGRTDEVNARQLAAVAERVRDWSRIVIAYEPVWAIGTGVVATPEQAQETHSNIRRWLAQNLGPHVAQNTRIMYGGSANAGNADILARQPDVDGFLVGGASLKPEFLRIVDSWKRKLE